MADKHNASGEEEGEFDKEQSSVYRANCEGCGKGYHGNRWDAHHLLPGVVFTKVKEDDPIGFISECLNGTAYDINASYSMCGLPKLTAFILYFQKDPTMAFQRSKEKTVTMKRWGKVKQYDYQKHLPVVFPGDFPVHNPVNWGHTKYNLEVLQKLNADVFDALRKKRDKTKHYEPEDLKQKITDVKDFFWGSLEERGQGEGIKGTFGIEANLRARYKANNHGWWKPLCMTNVPEPASP